MGWLEVSLQILAVSLRIWGLIYRHLGYRRDRNDNVCGKLKRKRDEVEVEVKDAESVGKKRQCDVCGRLQDEGEIVAEVGSIQSEFDCGKTNRLSQVVRTLQDKGIFDEVAKSPRRPLMTEWQVPSQIEQQSTAPQTLQEIEQALSDEEVGIVSIWGMGGVGKTTLMQKIYNRHRETRNFDRLLWVTVSKDLNLEVIQKKIGKELEMEFRDDEGKEDKRCRLLARLRNIRYMLILDDLWQKFSLDDIGIPQPDKENRCKIAITTRSVEVGNGMGADSVIRVKTLSSVEAWELFRSKTGDVVLQPEIQTLAKEVVRECAGLPLAIMTVGGAMRRKGQKELWQNALRALRAPAAPEVPGMEREVFLPLKLSYDCLEDREIQSCFLYCSLYPEDYEIFIADMVRHWAFEQGMINNVSSLHDALDKGHGIIDRLKDACLLEEGHHGDRYVRMHDLLRDLAVGITSPSSSSSTSFFLVKAGVGLVQPPEEKTWEDMERISLMRNQITELQMTPNCPGLVSLSLRENSRLHTIHNSFFQFMPKLKILDLRYAGIESLPPSLSQLVNLRVLDASQCRNLHDVPPFGQLKELQFLDLGGTGIESLPQGIARLAKLRSLELSGTKASATIPRGFISGLASLEDLGLYSKKHMMSMAIWREVATLPRLTNLRVKLPSLDAFSANDMKHPMWSRLSRFQVQFGHTFVLDHNYDERALLISDCEELPNLQKAFGGESPTGFQQLESISISGCHKLRCIFSSSMLQHLHPLESLTVEDCEEIVEIVEGGPLPDTVILPKLKSISIFGCHKLRCIFSSSMLQHLHPLESLAVEDCEEIVQIVEGGPLPDTALQRLSCLSLQELPKLTAICSGQLVLTSMEKIRIGGCPELKQLPVLCSGMQGIRGYISASREWWEGIEWEDEHSKSLYSIIYIERQGDDGEEASETGDDEESSETGDDDEA